VPDDAQGAADSGQDSGQGSGQLDRRAFVTQAVQAACAGVPFLILGGVIRIPAEASAQGDEKSAGPASTRTFGMGVDVAKCIGCGRCVAACKEENDVPRDAHHFNTWVERYVIHTNQEVTVDSPNGGIEGFPPTVPEREIERSFFVPKLCNHCAKPPCVQVCPVGATFSTRDGVVLVDDDYCIGCRYCIQACPYGARWFHPVKRVAQKCTFCYHRITNGQLPACVEVCPTGARVFGEVEPGATPLSRFVRMNEVQVLKPSMNTKPKVYYANLDGEVR